MSAEHPIRPPKPKARPDKIRPWQHLRLFRADILSAQPARLYRAWMAEFRLLSYRSYLVNQPELLELVLKTRPDDFPKSDLIRGALYTLLGNSVFVTNGAQWKRQRRIIDPAFAGGRLKDVFPAMRAAAHVAVERIGAHGSGPLEFEAEASRLAADVIFRTLFSIPIEDDLAQEVFESFRAYQRTQPLVNPASLLKLPRLIPALSQRKTRRLARQIRRLLTDLTMARGAQIAAGDAPDDLATKIMTTEDPQTGERFSAEEMVDQVAIFFLAGHETSAAALGWALYLLALDQEAQARVQAEIDAAGPFDFAGLSKLRFTRDVFREALRLYPPVPMMVRETTQPEELRNRAVRVGSQIVLSPWHLHRHERLWEDPDLFRPDRWEEEHTRQLARSAYMPFSAGPRICTGAGFAMIEGVVLMAELLRAFHITPVEGKEPVPVAHLTLRAKDGIYLKFMPRGCDPS